ncbi:MAG: 2Fe-2S iron-sulfur cluster binding domain-containing protein [Hyphomicrobiales bacterium]|nr:2Fe-2S iron-sulfur cluster binding domain-containing protein [Hyphomicrobiales bacterium]MCP4999675.1 2Fe-2S iron-sulfur cluster binding domain-containing protein [Hyphomicrobiales bacterium]
MLALVGFVDAGNEVIEDRISAIEAPAAEEPELSEAEQQEHEEAAAQRAEEIGQQLALAARIMWIVIGIYALLVLLTFIARAARLHKARRTQLSIRYQHGSQIDVKAGASMLEISRLNNLPHANLCRGRGRCGTCRIRVIEANPPLPEPGPIEAKTLARLRSPTH